MAAPAVLLARMTRDRLRNTPPATRVLVGVALLALSAALLVPAGAFFPASASFESGDWGGLALFCLAFSMQLMSFIVAVCELGGGLRQGFARWRYYRRQKCR